GDVTRGEAGDRLTEGDADRDRADVGRVGRCRGHADAGRLAVVGAAELGRGGVAVAGCVLGPPGGDVSGDQALARWGQVEGVVAGIHRREGADAAVAGGDVTRGEAGDRLTEG